MSADNQMDIDVITDNGVTHSMVRMWAAKVQEQPAMRTNREDLLLSFKDDPKMADAMKSVRELIPKGCVVFITRAESGVSKFGPNVQLTVRF